ncbi:MAG: arylsulfatase [Planctomycetota bacterium]|jgi:arylsulfatase
MWRDRTGYTRVIALAAALAAAGSTAATGAPDAGATPQDPVRRKPNIVFILADDLGWAELGCYGQTKIRTPSIDRIAAEGIRFTQHYSGSPVCAPSRCVLLTGLHTGHAFVRDNREQGGWGPDEPEGQLELPAGTVTVGRLLQQAGYATAAIGKWGLGGPGSSGEPNRQGFDHWYGYLCQRVAHNHYPTHLWRNGRREELDGNVWGNLTGPQYAHDLMAAEALRFIEQNRDGPFFLYLAFTIPHLAIQVPDDALAEYRGAWPDPPYEGGKGYLPHPAPRAGYAAMVTRMDRDVGRILDLLRRLDLDRNTIVMFSSDNGATYDIGGADSPFFDSAGPLRGRKGSVWEGGLRVPLVARWPGRIAPGRGTDHVSAFWDLLPTLMDLAAAETPADLDGISYAPTLLGDRPQRRHAYLYWEFPSKGYSGQQAVRVGDFKGVRRRMHKGNTAVALYNLADDIGERTDVAALHPEVVQRMEQIMRDAHAPSRRFPMPLLDN